MSYQVIARKWRPQTFADVVGPAARHAHAAERHSQSGRVAHAYIFSGARGVGKTTTARILAKALNCAKGPPPEPCNECDSCREIAAGNSLDVLEIDAASNRGIDQVRELRDMVRYAPAGGRYKVVILDEAHMLTDEASNALLKTLEEPPDKVIFVMATTQPEDLADTIRSRSQHFHFRALSFAEICRRPRSRSAQKENLNAEPGALAVMARAADGSLRDALSLLEQARAYCGANITRSAGARTARRRPRRNSGRTDRRDRRRARPSVRSALVHRLLAEGQNLQHFCREAIGHFRNLLVARVCGADSDLIAAPAEERPRLARAAAAFSEEDLTRFFQILLHTDDDLRRKPDPRLHLEMGLLRMVNAARLAPLEEVLAELSGNAAPCAAANRRGNCRAHKRARRKLQRAAAASSPAPRSRFCRARAAASSAAASANADAAAARQRCRCAASEQPVLPQRAASTVARTRIQPASKQLKWMPSKRRFCLQEKFLGELVEHAHRWEMDGGEVRLFFPTESRALAEMLQARDPMETLRNIASRVLGQPLRVCVKLEGRRRC